MNIKEKFGNDLIDFATRWSVNKETYKIREKLILTALGEIKKMYRFIVKGLSKNIYIKKKINNQIDDIEFSFKTREQLNFHSSKNLL